MVSEPLKYSYDEDKDELTVEGIRYSGQFFRNFGTLMMPGQLFRLDKREGGVVTVTNLDAVEALHGK